MAQGPKKSQKGENQGPNSPIWDTIKRGYIVIEWVNERGMGCEKPTTTMTFHTATYNTNICFLNDICTGFLSGNEGSQSL